jgi:hypothetical protein
MMLQSDGHTFQPTEFGARPCIPWLTMFVCMCVCVTNVVKN